MTSMAAPAKRYDYVIVCSRQEGDVSGGCCGDSHKVLNGRRWVEENLKAAGLITSVVESRNKDDLFIRITATQARLEKHAEYMKLQIPTQIPIEGDAEGAMGDYMVFVSQATDPEKRKLFPPEFSSATRYALCGERGQRRSGGWVPVAGWDASVWGISSREYRVWWGAGQQR